MRIRSIYIVDLNQFIEAINKDVLLFSLDYDVTNVNDLTNLFISRIILKMIEVQKNISNLFVFYYINLNYKEKLIKEGTLIKYKKFFNLIEKKVKFSLIKENLIFKDFIEKLEKNDSLYDEFLLNYHSFSEILPTLIDTVKKYRYKKIDNEIIKEVKNLIKLISSI